MAGYEALGADPSDPIAILAAQVSRFGPTAPAGYRVVAAPLLATGNITPELALAAVTIFQRAATDSYNQFHDQGSADQIARANKGFANPVVFVGQNLAEVTQAVGSLANALGLPVVSASGAPEGASDDAPSPVMFALAIALAIWVLR